MTWNPPLPGDPCRDCGAVVNADEHPVRYATTDSCAACGMAPTWRTRRCTDPVCGAPYTPDVRPNHVVGCTQLAAEAVAP